MSTTSDAPPRERESTAPPPSPPAPPSDGWGAGGNGDGGVPERVKSPGRSALELLVALTVIVALAILSGEVNLLIVIVAIIVMVMVHELGHLLAAKRGGMKVTAYFVGFGPRLWSIRRGETEYGVKAIPAGGYVKIPGMTNLEEVDPEDEPRAYRNQPFRFRLLVAVAGSAMHFIMAFLLLWGLLAFVGVGNTNKTQVAGFVALGVPNPARAGGLHAGDIVISVNGKPVAGDVNGLAAAIRINQGRPIAVVVDRAGHRLHLTVTPVDGRTAHEQGVTAPSRSGPDGVLGIFLTNPTETMNPIHAVGTSVVDLGSITWQSLRGVANLFSPHQVASRFDQITSAKAANQAAANGTRAESIVGVVRTADQAAQSGIGNLLVVLITINIFFGVFNMFPMLPLDGGHVVIAIYERIRTRRGGPMYHADAAKMMPFAYILLAFLAVLVVTALIVDLAHPMANPFG